VKEEVITVPKGLDRSLGFLSFFQLNGSDAPFCHFFFKEDQRDPPLHERLRFATYKDMLSFLGKGYGFFPPWQKKDSSSSIFLCSPSSGLAGNATVFRPLLRKDSLLCLMLIHSWPSNLQKG